MEDGAVKKQLISILQEIRPRGVSFNVRPLNSVRHAKQILEDTRHKVHICFISTTIKQQQDGIRFIDYIRNEMENHQLLIIMVHPDDDQNRWPVAEMVEHYDLAGIIPETYLVKPALESILTVALKACSGCKEKRALLDSKNNQLEYYNQMFLEKVKENNLMFAVSSMVMDIPVILFNTSMTCFDANLAATDYFNTNREDFISKSILDTIDLLGPEFQVIDSKIRLLDMFNSNIYIEVDREINGVKTKSTFVMKVILAPFGDKLGYAIIRERFKEIHSKKHLQRIEKEAVSLDEIEVRSAGIDGIIGQNVHIVNLCSRIKSISSNTTAPVLITGETGVGKELFSRAVHDYSSRRKKPFRAINCASLERELLESQLFGYVKGAFTGADHDKDGLLKTVDGGTLFLDELAEADMVIQSKLLRVIESGEFQPVGSNDNVRVDVRIVAATNVNLKKAIEDHKFREDLYYRINILEGHIPPLRERIDDIMMLANYFLRQKGIPHKIFSGEVVHAFLNYQWPGNIRELYGVIKHIHATHQGGTIRMADLKEDFKQEYKKRLIEEECLEMQLNGKKDNGNDQKEIIEVEDDEIRKMIYMLEKYNGNKKKASEHLGMHRSTFYRKIGKHRDRFAKYL